MSDAAHVADDVIKCRIGLLTSLERQNLTMNAHYIDQNPINIILILCVGSV